MVSRPGKPSRNQKDVESSAREERAIKGKIQKDTQSGKRMSPRDIADIAEAARKNGEATQKRNMER